MQNEEKSTKRAIRAYAARCNREGWIYQQPSSSSGVRDGMVVLVNSNGPLAAYKIMPNGSLRWADQVPAD